jgi:hypothetical protein
MATPEQIAANRENAQKSTGPKTETGKAASSQNGFQHGLFGVFRVLNTESQMQYQDLLQGLLSEYNPTTPTESILVERMAQHHWLRHRALFFQSNCLESEHGLDTARLSLFMRYETMHERAYHKCLNDLLKLRAEKQKEENGFASQEHKTRMRELDLLCREADVIYHTARGTGAQLHLEYKQNDKKNTQAPQNSEAHHQKAA